MILLMAGAHIAARPDCSTNARASALQETQIELFRCAISHAVKEMFLVFTFFQIKSNGSIFLSAQTTWFVADQQCRTYIESTIKMSPIASRKWKIVIFIWSSRTTLAIKNTQDENLAIIELDDDLLHFEAFIPSTQLQILFYHWVAFLY